MKQKLEIGRFVKIKRDTGYEMPENFWVEITAVEWPWYQGRVDNTLLGDRFTYNDIVKFSHTDIRQVFEFKPV